MTPSPTDDETPFPTLDGSEPYTNAFGRSHLSPDDAFTSPPRRLYGADGVTGRPNGERSRSRRRKRAWKKLMWVKQSYPDNYTDQATFLEHLQRNPRLKPYDFWPLVADTTVILQHVCSVIMFLTCFIGISNDQLSPVSVVSSSSIATFLGWLVWERWVAEDDEVPEGTVPGSATVTATVMGRTGSLRRRGRTGSLYRPTPLREAAAMLNAGPSRPLGSISAENSAASSTTNLDVIPQPSRSSSNLSLHSGGGQHTPRASQEALPRIAPPMFVEESRLHQRLGTIKSAILIYCTLLGLSPILKSLTRSTSSDSIWAMSGWLLLMNVFFFDYSGGVGAKFPASLSTNAALMASTVLASRLPSTQQVFSITLFSIQVFGLFPAFRRHLKHRHWQAHVLLAVLLVLSASFGLGLMIGGWTLKHGIVGMLLGTGLAILGMGGCSWWLIGLQKYKNEIRGPWDPARPIIMSRTRWDENR